jgi:hypothetical protein
MRVAATAETGMVTAEAAVVLPALVLVLALCLGAIGVGIGELRCVDAARAGARALARGETSAQAVRAARAAAPSGASVRARSTGAVVEVTVSARVPLFGALARRVSLPVSAHASAEVEPGRESG